MKLSFLYRLLFDVFFLAVFFIGFSSCEPDDITEQEEETLVVNQWVDEVMKEVYLWNSKIPSSVNYKDEADPEELFNKMLYTEEDYWSWITDDWASYEKELEGTPVSMGYAPAFFYKDETSDDVIIVIRYVYKDSPADKAGLKRGDIILTIDGTTLNVDNYYDLYSGDSYTVGLGTYSTEENTISSSGVSKSITAISFEADPVIHYEVKEIEDSKIGYLVYSDFTSGVNDAFLDSVGNVMDYFLENSVTDVIVDLRYNLGGESGAATYLASALAPKSVVEDNKVLVKMIYNKNVQDYFEQKDDDSHLTLRFSSNESNLNLNRIYFLTAKSTASASELVIAGLDPYMDVVMVGDSTYGKYTGAWVLPDTNDPPKHNWCMVPIVSKYSNVSGFTNFKDGIAPDVYLKDYLLPARQFGDLNDEILAAAIEQITGMPLSTMTKSARIKPALKELHPKEMEIKRNMILPINDSEAYMK